MFLTSELSAEDYLNKNVVVEAKEVTTGILKKWVSELMGTNKNTTDYSLYRSLYNDLDKDDDWYSLAKEINLKKINNKSDFHNYVKTM